MRRDLPRLSPISNKIGSTYWVNSVRRESSYNPETNTLEPDRLQHNTAARAIAQQYSSAFISLRVFQKCCLNVYVFFFTCVNKKFLNLKMSELGSTRSRYTPITLFFSLTYFCRVSSYVGQFPKFYTRWFKYDRDKM